MKTSIYNANRPFTVRIPAAAYEQCERGGLNVLAEELIKKDFNGRGRRKNALDNKERPKFEGEKVRVSVNARVDSDLAKKVRKLLKSSGIKPRDYVAELVTANFEGRKPIFPAEKAAA